MHFDLQRDGMLRLYGVVSKQLTLETNSKRGTIDPGVVVRRSRFETTALEMPAGFGVFTIAPILHAMGGRARTYGQAM